MWVGAIIPFSLIGAFIMGVMNNGMGIMGIGIDWQQVIKGAVLMLAVFTFNLLGDGLRDAVDPRFEFVRHDVVDPFKFEVDQIYNLACPASPVHYQYNPVKTVNDLLRKEHQTK